MVALHYGADAESLCEKGYGLSVFDTKSNQIL